MSNVQAIDVIKVLESAQPTGEDMEAVRGAVCANRDARKRVEQLIASLPSDATRGAADPKSAQSKGLALWAVGREAEASSWLESADATIANAVRARALVAAGRPAEAVAVIGEPNGDGFAAQALAEALANLGDADRLETALAAVEKTGSAADSAYFKGRLADLNGERSVATASYEAAVAADEEHALALFRLAYNQTTYGDEEEALELYRRCIECACPPVNAYLNLGNLYEDRGEFSKARECYQAVLQHDGTNARARMFDIDAVASLNMFYDEDMERRADKHSQVLRLPVTDFELSVRSRNCLAKMGVRTLGDLIQRSEAELLSYKNFGETSLQEIKDILAQKSLRLGMGVEEASTDDKARSILEGIGVVDEDRRKNLEKPLSELELSVRSRHCMNVLGMKTVGDLMKCTEPALMTIKNFGQTSLNEVKQKLAELGLSLASAK